MNTPTQHNPYQASAVDVPLYDGDGETEVELASPWRRMGAYIINTLLSIAVFLPIAPALFAIWTGSAPELNYTSLGMGTLASIVLGLGLLIWQCIWMTQRGQSVGKRLLGIKVVDLNGNNPGFVGTVLLREVVYGLLVMVFAFIIGAVIGVFFGLTGNLEGIEAYSTLFDLIGYIPTIVCTIMLFRTQTLRRTLQDYIAKTIVIKA